MQVIIAEKFIVLFVTDPRINQDKPFTIFYQQAPKSPGTKIIRICRIRFIPDGLRYYTKHGTPIEFEKAGVDCVQLHYKIWYMVNGVW
jgi:hypothetical protein